MRLAAAIAFASLVTAPVAARADASSDEDPIVRDLETRNAEREATFDTQARATQKQLAAEADRDQVQLERRTIADHESAVAFHDAERRAHDAGMRKAGYIVGGIGLALGALGTGAWMSAGDREDAVKQGTYATGHDITNAQTWIQILQTTSYITWSGGAVLTATGLGLVW